MDGYFSGGGEYDPQRDGPLEKYFETHDGSSCCSLFKGPDIYEELWDEGWLWPGYSNIRVMWNEGRGDGHYGVLSKTELEGAKLVQHAGKPGIHLPRDILSQGPNWEVGSPGRAHLSRKERLEQQKVFIDLTAKIRAMDD